MKLSLMKNFYATLDENGKSPVLDAITSRWFGSSGSKLLRASANFIAIVESKGLTYYLRFNHDTERTIHHVKNELAYIQRLILNGVNANKPVPSIDGNLFESIDTDLGVFNAVLFTEMKGDHIESDDLDLKGFSKWGASLAEIHTASQGFELNGASEWSDQLNLLTKLVPENEVLLSEIASIRAQLSEVSRVNYGLIVFDFEMDNIKWDRGEPGFMDFDDYCVHWYAADVAYALRDLYDDLTSMFDPEDERFQAFVRGYRGVRDIPNEELYLIPVFIRLHNLYFYARIHRANTGYSEDDPEWVIDLSKKLGEKNEAYLKDIIDNPII